MPSRNTFSIEGDLIFINNSKWDRLAVASIRDDYVDELCSVTWGKKGEYVHNRELGYLHRYIMAKWYGDDMLRSMTEENYVVDHMDNDGFNCAIDNLSFLQNSENKAKGLTFDQKNKDKLHIALNIFKDFSTGLFQTTIHFNYPPALILPDLDKPAYTFLAYFLYGTDYSTMLLDCSQILNEYYNSYTFSPEYLRFIDYHIEGAYGRYYSVEEYDHMMSTPSSSVKFFFNKRAPIKGWLPTENRRVLILHPTLN